MNGIEQFAKISPFVNENGIMLEYANETYSCDKNMATLKNKEIGICISFKNKNINNEFLENKKITITDENREYLTQSLITMIDNKVVKLAGTKDSANIDQFPGHNVDVDSIDTSAFKFELTESGTSYKLVGLSEKGKSELPITDICKIILPYEYKSVSDESPLPVTIIDPEPAGFGALNGRGYLEIYIPYSVDMIRDQSFPPLEYGSVIGGGLAEIDGCKLILCKHVLIF